MSWEVNMLTGQLTMVAGESRHDVAKVELSEDSDAILKDALRFRALRDAAKEVLLHPGRANSEICPDLRTKWEIPTLICSGPVGGFLSFEEAVDIFMENRNGK